MVLVDQALKKIGDPTATVWLGGYWNGTAIQWDDNSAPEYNNLIDKKANSGYLVLRLSDGKWDIVQTGSYAVSCIGQDQGAPCDDEWLYSAKLKSCYKLIGNFSGFTWYEAHLRCMSLGGQLTSIHSDEENRIVVELADTYLGLNFDLNNLTTASTWVGAYRDGPGLSDFAWTDGTAFDYANWAATQPDNMDGRQPRVHIYTTHHIEYGPNDSKYLHKWDDIYIDSRGNNAICKKAATF
ncbi:unnamed protein product, partial [Mesorhabditis spiculigera]